MIGLIDAHGNSKAKATWSFFTFLKLPRLLIELNKNFDKQKQQQQSTQTQPQQTQNQKELVNSSNFINDLKQAFDRLCEYSPLLDEAEYKCNCDLFKCLVKELIKNDQSLMQLKNIDFRKSPARRPMTTNNNNNLGGHMMLKTEPVVTHMLDTLNSDQDPVELFSVLCQSCSGISFEYTLSAAAATGRLHIFVKRLVEHNELYKSPREYTSAKHYQAQAFNFDITFLILIYIAQRYGADLIERDQTATFNKWYYECYNQSTCFNCPKEMLKNYKEDIVTDLIKKLLYPNQDIQLNSVRWNDICFNTPKAISEILDAWTQNQINDNDIAIVIERLRSKMCFMAVVASNWLRCHIKTLNESDKAKPLHILSHLSKPSQLARQQKMTNDSNAVDGGETNELKWWGYAERSSLMGAIIRRIHFELAPSRSTTPNTSSTISTSGTTVTKTGTSGYYLGESDDSQDESSYHSYKDRFISVSTTRDIFLANVKQCLSRGWIDYNSLNSISSLFKIIGSKCFTSLMVNEILTSHESPSDLSRAVNITFGLFHLDIEACAFDLLNDVLPDWLMSEKKQVLLNQPRAFALANLAVMTIIEVFDNLFAARASLSEEAVSRSNIRPNESEIKPTMINGIKQELSNLAYQQKSTAVVPMMVDQIEASSNGIKENVKRIKLMHQERSNSTLNGVGSDNNSVGSNRNGFQVNEFLDRLNGYIGSLMKLFSQIMSDSVISHRTLFPILFLQQTVVCAREGSAMITVHLQPEILLDIIDLFSSELTFELVLAISNLSMTHSRKYAAKSICKLAQLEGSDKSSRPTVVGQSNSGAAGTLAGGTTFWKGGGPLAATGTIPSMVKSPATGELT